MVFRVEVKERIGEERSFTQAIRAALQDVPGVAKGSGRQIGMGGMFKILGGTSKMHVQPDWSTIDKRSPGYVLPPSLVVLQSFFSRSSPLHEARMFFRLFFNLLCTPHPSPH